MVFYLKIACDQRRKIFKISLTLFINTWLVVVVQHSRVLSHNVPLAEKGKNCPGKGGEEVLKPSDDEVVFVGSQLKLPSQVVPFPPRLISPFLLCWNCNLVWNHNQGGSGRGISRAYVQQSGAVSCWHFICLSGVDGEEFLSSFFFVLLLSAIYYFVTNWDRIGITFGFLCDLHLGSKFKKYNV